MTKMTLGCALSLLLGCGGSSTPENPDAATPTADAARPDAGLVPCDMEGATRAGPCGNCGMQSQLCSGGFWVPQGACLGEGECSPGSTETAAAPLCGEQQRLCDNQCAWSDWAVTTPGTGDCEPGDTRIDQQDCVPGLYRHQSCDDTCAWTTLPDACVDACGEMPRVTVNFDEQEVCIPAGDFIRGQPGWPETEPVTTVSMSAYYIDRYPLTMRRYKACYDAGACSLPQSWEVEAFMNNPAVYGAYIMYSVSWADAEAFCAWDSGRQLVTEAQFEKAARGPAPRANLYPWDDSTYRCDLLPVVNCPGYTPPPSDEPETDPYYAFMDAGSYYDVYGLLGGGPQWNRDFYDPDYYSLPESLVDPEGPATGSARSFRGYTRVGTYATSSTISQRESALPFGGGSLRCGRTAAGL